MGIGIFDAFKKKAVEERDHSFFMARQPIYDRDMRLSGYELLYRSGGGAAASQMTSNLELSALANVLVEVGLDKLARRTKAFVNVPSSLLGSDALRMLPSNRVVLEILEDTPWNSTVESNIRELKRRGYTMALDDYIFGDEHAPFLEHVDIVKIDVLGMHPDKLKSNMGRIRRGGQRYLAEKVETYEVVDYCLRLGFDFFQGYFIAKPKTIRGTGIPANHASTIALLAKLNDPKVSMDDLEKLLAGNVVLAHKVLRLVNSVAMGSTKHVDSLRQALQQLGTEKVRSLATLALTTAIRGKPPELYTLAMVRANYCEQAARASGFGDPEKHFMVGLLSVLEALTDVSMRELVAELPLAPEIREALTGKTLNSPCSKTLHHTLAVEAGDWKKARSILSKVPAETYVNAVDRAQRDEGLLSAAA